MQFYLVLLVLPLCVRLAGLPGNERVVAAADVDRPIPPQAESDGETGVTRQSGGTTRCTLACRRWDLVIPAAGHRHRVLVIVGALAERPAARC